MGLWKVAGLFFYYEQADKPCSVSDLMVCAYIYTVELQWLEHLWDHKS